MSSKKLKVVHISTHCTGGAGLAALRIHQALSGFTNSNLLTVDKVTLPNVCTLKFQPKTFLNRQRNKLAKYFGSKQKKYNKMTGAFANSYPQLNGSFASLPFSTWNLLDNPFVKTADIIHLHWVAGILDYPSFFSKINKPVFWTLHDMNAIMGIFHYRNDEMDNEHYYTYNREIYAIKQECIKKSKAPLFYITPSIWLQQAVKQDLAFSKYEGRAIYNCVDPVFFNADPSSIVEELQLPADRTIFVFIAQSIADKRKGIDILLKALSTLESTEFLLLVIGETAGMDFTGYNVKQMGIISDPVKLASVYAAADALLLTSREDNLPNVMIEALSSGTPVLCFDTGGMSQVILDNFNGIKAKEITKDSFGAVLENFIRNKKIFNRNQIRDFAIANFSPDVIARQYYHFYNDALKNNHDAS